MIYKLSAIILAVFCFGCVKTGQIVKIKSDCPPQTSRNQIISDISASGQDLIEFAAKGSATVRFLAENRTESLPGVTGYFSDRRNVVIKVSHTFGTAIVLGTNPDWFWCWINFSKINDYYTGAISQLESCGAKGLKTFPVAEVFGIIDAASLEKSVAVFEDAEYSLDVFDAQGSRQRSYYFNNCTRELVRIKYYEDGRPTVIAEFAAYKQLSGNTSLPTDVDIFSVNDNLRLSIKIDRFIPLTMTPEKKAKLYSLPEPAAGTQVYTLGSDCRFVMQ